MRVASTLSALMAMILGVLAPWHEAQAADPQATLPALGALPRCPKGTEHCLALDVWMAPGNAKADTSWLRDQIEAANERLGVIGVGVEVVRLRPLPEAEHTIDSAELRTASGATRIGKGKLTLIVPLRLVDLDGESERRGVTWRIKGRPWVILSREAWKWVLAHELGHVFGLPHSKAFRSIMNKKTRPILPTQLEFTPAERPIMVKTLKSLLAKGWVGDVQASKGRKGR